MAYARKDQAKLSDAEWTALIEAIDRLHGSQAPSPAYRQFVGVHNDAMTTAEGMTWAVHTMQGMGMVGRNFLAWHRQYLLRFERQLQKVAGKPVAVPYWNWLRNPEIPEPLADAALLRRWSVKRGTWTPDFLPTRGIVNAVLREDGYRAFQSDLEAIHGGAHNAVGGDMAKARSPNDPLFWLHHAYIDRLFARWQASTHAGPPPNPNEMLKPAPILGVKVKSVMKISTLGYRYGT
jgi:Common central domain of tyrosinase